MCALNVVKGMKLKMKKSEFVSDLSLRFIDENDYFLLEENREQDSTGRYYQKYEIYTIYIYDMESNKIYFISIS